MPKEQGLRCFCRTNPLLATYGMDKEGRLFVRMRIFKGNRIYGEMVCLGGPLKIKCRNCLRWHNVTFAPNVARLEQENTSIEGPTAV